MITTRRGGYFAECIDDMCYGGEKYLDNVRMHAYLVNAGDVMATPKNEAATALVNLRWSRTTQEQRSQVGREMALARWGRRPKTKTKTRKTKTNK